MLEILSSTLRVATPLLFATLAGLLSERSGVINIALEGMMLIGAFAAAAGAHFFHCAVMGIVTAAFLGVAVGLFYGLLVVRFRTNQIVAGTALNFLAAGLTPFLCKILFGVPGASPALEISERFLWGPQYAVWILVAIVAFWFKNSRTALWVQFAGEHPLALSAAGVSVKRVRMICLGASGLLAAVGGATLSTFLSSSFSRNMTAGRGFMALAALIFGKWRPWPAAFACLLFALADAAQIRLQGIVLFGALPVPVQWIQALPYLFTVIVLAGFVGNARAPKALGLPYEGA